MHYIVRNHFQLLQTVVIVIVFSLPSLPWSLPPTSGAPSPLHLTVLLVFLAALLGSVSLAIVGHLFLFVLNIIVVWISLFIHFLLLFLLWLIILNFLFIILIISSNLFTLLVIILFIIFVNINGAHYGLVGVNCVCCGRLCNWIWITAQIYLYSLSLCSKHKSNNNTKGFFYFLLFLKWKI